MPELQAKLLLIFINQFLEDRELLNKIKSYKNYLFTIKELEKIFDNIVEFLNGNSSIDLETIKNELRKYYPINNNVQYTKTMFDSLIKFVLKENAYEEISNIFQNENNLSILSNRLVEIGRRLNLTFSDAKLYLQSLSEIKNKNYDILTTGIKRIDEEFPIVKGEYVIVGGRPGSGKTAFALNLITYMLVEDIPQSLKPTVLFLSFELPASMLLRRLCYIIQSYYSHYNNTSLDFNEAKEIAHDLIGNNLLIYSLENEQNLGRDFISIYDKILKNNKFDIMIIDYLQLLHLKGNHKKNRYEELKEISGMLVDYKNSTETTIIALSQLSRDVDKRKSIDFYLSDLKESGALEADADKVIVLYVPRPKDIQDIRKEEKDLIYFVLKNRTGISNDLLYFKMLNNGFIF
jgi:replicative DNA helicase